MNRKLMVGVIGSSVADRELEGIAREVGREIALAGGVLICGGLAGVMEAACRGAKEAGGTTIGVLPGLSQADANPFVDFPILTGLGEARNVIVVSSAEAVIACGGGPGTLSEIAFALRQGKILAGIQTWKITDRAGYSEFFPQFEQPKLAVEYVFKKIGGEMNG
ncbi:MAG: hypothetical protein PWP04_520 [Candidatus Atribacteria bacterium]|nr:hypothetical protein [Candidatus Atribacteria bacterium]